ncbi:MAG: hypothetical protein ACYSTQ_09520 [Planctomycetota bacterium]|jgi:hypothetical protein
MSTIPIIIDDIKRYDKFRMSRCTFFSIAYDLPSPDWVLELEDSSIPFFLLGLSGIIWKPMGKRKIFDACDSIRPKRSATGKTRSHRNNFSRHAAA